MTTHLKSIMVDTAALACFHDKLQEIIGLNKSIQEFEEDDIESISESVDEVLSQSRVLVAITSAELSITLVEEGIVNTMDPTVGVGNIPPAAKSTDNERINQTSILVESSSKLKLFFEHCADEDISSEAKQQLIQKEQKMIADELNQCLYALKSLFELVD